MAAKPLTFAADVDAWVKQTEQRMTAVFRGSAEDVVSVMQTAGWSMASTKGDIAASGKKIGPVTAAGHGGNMPVDTGFLRASLVASNSKMPVTSRPNPDPDAKYPYVPEPVVLVIKGTELGQSLYVG